MEISCKELEKGIKLVKLSGMLDVMGVSIAEKKLKVCCAENGLTVFLDLSGVSFLASIGIRLIVTTAKSVMSRDGKLAMFSPAPSVREVLDISGITSVIPIFTNLEEARTQLLV